MKKSLFAVLLAGFAAVQAANAVSIDFDSPLPTSVSASFSRAQIVQGTGSNGLGMYAAPFGDTTNYLSVQTNGTATFTFGVPQSSLSLIWGSVDLYNTIEFFNNGALVASFSGGDVIPGADGNQGPDGTVSVPLIQGTVFNSFKLSDFSMDAFEVDNVVTTDATTVPDGGATAALLGLAMVAIVAVRSKLRLA